MKYYFFLIFGLCVFCFSCDRSTVFKTDFKSFKSNRWFVEDELLFEVEMEKEGEYNVVLFLSHVYGIDCDELPIILKIIDPNGDKIEQKVGVKLKNKKGTDLGECLGDICDLEVVLKKKVKFFKGKYFFKIKNDYIRNYLPNVIGVGMGVKKEI